MVEFSKQSPFLNKLALVLFCIIALGYIIYVGQDVIIPIALAVALAILLLPMNAFLEFKKIPRVFSILISIIFSLLVIAGIIYFFSRQVALFIADIPHIKAQLQHHLLTVQQWVFHQFHLTDSEQKQYFNKATAEIQDNKGGFIGATFLTITNSIMFLVFLPIYTFLILYYRDMIKIFLINIFAEHHKEHVEHVMRESRLIVNGYMMGLLIEMAIITLINYIGFLIVGIKFAFFLALFSAILNMIPYIGMLIAGVVSMLVTLATSDYLSNVIWVAVVLTVVQFFDNNIIMPKIVSSKVKINALATILGVLIGGAIAGVSGMFLSIPAVAIMKVIFDRIPELKPWGAILGDDITMNSKGRLIRKLAEAKMRRKKMITS